VTAPSPALLAAKTNTQMEFQRTVESIRRGSEYAGKNLLFIAGLNLDISRHADYPANTFFVPWAAYVQSRDDDASEHRLPMEQERIHALLMEQDMENPDQISLSDEITRMLESPRFDIRSPA